MGKRGSAPKPAMPRGLLRSIVAAAAEEFGFRPSELVGAGTGGHPSLSLSHARAVAMWLAYGTGQTTFVELAGYFGVGYPSCRARVKSIEVRREKQPKFRERLDRLRDRIGVAP
jgi:chromosomal replication initiation ATPase DnaA